jgi:hypothetical protein
MTSESQSEKPESNVDYRVRMYNEAKAAFQAEQRLANKEVAGEAPDVKTDEA